MPAILQTPTPDIQASLDFYTKLDFKVVSTSPNLLSDGKVLIEINEDRYARAGVKLFQTEWTAIVEQLKTITEVIKIQDAYLLSDPSGAWIYLMEKAGPNVSIDQIAPSVLGNYAGISLESVDMSRSLKIWEILGFSQTMGSLEQGWISLANQEGISVSLMKPNACPHLFFNPSVSYFNGKDNLAVIEKIRELAIPISEEISFFNKQGIVDNIIIRDPGGFGFFIFSD